MPRKKKRLKYMIVAGHFSEITLRFAEALSVYFDVLVLVDDKNYKMECGDDFTVSSKSLRVIRVKRLIRWHNIPFFLAKIASFRPNFIHYEEILDKWFNPFLRIGRIFAKTVLRVHDPDKHSGRDERVSPKVDADRHWNRRHVDVAAVHGDYCKHRFEANYDTPVINTRHGVIFIPKAAALRRPLPGHILMFGRMEAYKGLDILVEAVKILSAKQVPFHLTVAGRGPELDRMMPTLRSMPNIMVLDNFLLPQQVVDLYQNTEIVVLPYKDATQSGVVAGAFGNGRLVVASKVGGLPDVVKDGVNGVLCEPSSPQALADALERVLTNPKLAKQLSEGACRSASTDLAWSGIAEDFNNDLVGRFYPKARR